MMSSCVFAVLSALVTLGTLTPRGKPVAGDRQWSISSTCLDRDFADFDEYKNYLVPLGIWDVRFQAGWAKTEREKGKFDFAWLDALVDYCVTNGLNPVMETSYGNPIYAGGGGRDLSAGMPSGEEALAAWDRWIDALAGHFKGRVHSWLMWNEPDIGGNSPERIVALNVRTARIIKRHDPDASIGAFCFAGIDTKRLKSCFEAFGPDDAKLFDRYVYHGYAMNPDSSYPAVEGFKAVVRKYAPHAVAWQGENGCPSERTFKFALAGRDWTECSQAKWDLRRMLGDLGHDVPSAVFTMCDFYHNAPNSSARRVEMNRKGLLRANEDHKVVGVKRAFGAVRNCVTVFDPSVARVKDSPVVPSVKGVAFYTYKKGTSPLYVFWDASDVPSESEELRMLSFSAVGEPIRDPVWVDLLSGRVAAFDSSSIRREGGRTVYSDVPFYDSPVLLTSAAELCYNTQQCKQK